jgi:hypothetical protein
MPRVPLRDLAGVIFRDLMRPTRTKLAVLAFLFVTSIMAERDGSLVIGRPGNTAFDAENPVAVVILALLVRAVTQGAHMGLFPPMTAGLLHRIVIVLSLMAVIALVVVAIGAPLLIIPPVWLFVLILALQPRQDSGAPLIDDKRIDCPVCDGYGYLLDDDDSQIECEHCDGSGKVPAEKAKTQAG